MKRELKIDFSATRAFAEVDHELKLVIRRAILSTIAYEGFPYPARVSVTLCDNAYIHRLNKQYRGVDRPTDVLSFPLYADGAFDEPECRHGATLGDIVISLERAKEQAKQIGNSFCREVAFLAVHSTLHLLGYDHELGEREDEEQCRRQKEIMAGLDI